MTDEQTDDRTYAVVYNDEEQYSIWWVERERPAGWFDTGVHGTRAECLAHIERVWIDMRPLSLRERMAEQSSAGAGSRSADGPERR